MKGKTYYQSHKVLKETPIVLLQNRESARPWLEDPCTPIYYMWRSSIPRNWHAISPRPAYRIRGRMGKRDTMEFLKETQRYIDQIRKPISGEEEILGISKNSPRLRSASPPTTAAEHPRPVTSLQYPMEKQCLGTAVVLANPPFSPTASSPVSPCSSPPPDGNCRPRLQRISSTPQCITESLSVFPSAEAPQKDYIVTAYVRPHLLVSKTKKERKERSRRANSPEMAAFLSRFERKESATVAVPGCKGLPGWKLTMNSRVQSARVTPKAHGWKDQRLPRTPGDLRACTPWQLKLTVGRE